MTEPTERSIDILEQSILYIFKLVKKIRRSSSHLNSIDEDAVTFLARYVWDVGIELLETSIEYSDNNDVTAPSIMAAYESLKIDPIYAIDESKFFERLYGIYINPEWSISLIIGQTLIRDMWAAVYSEHELNIMDSLFLFVNYLADIETINKDVMVFLRLYLQSLIRKIILRTASMLPNDATIMRLNDVKKTLGLSE